MNERSTAVMDDWIKGKLDRVAAPAKRGAEPPAEVQDERFFGHLRGLQDTGKSIEVRRREGSWPALRYVYLKYSEWINAGEFRMYYVTGEQVIVKGRNLRELYDHLLSEKLAYIREAGDDERGQEFELFVDELTYVAPSDDKADDQVRP